MIVKLRCKGKQDIDADGNPLFDRNGNPIIVPDLPDHKFKWRICEFDEFTGEFIVTAEIEDDNEVQKVKDHLDFDFLDYQEKKIMALKQLRLMKQ